VKCISRLALEVKLLMAWLLRCESHEAQDTIISGPIN